MYGGRGEPYTSRTDCTHDSVEFQTAFSAQTQMQIKRYDAFLRNVHRRKIRICLKTLHGCRIRCFPCRFSKVYGKIT